MTSEETPLLVGVPDIAEPRDPTDHDHFYGRFTPWRKRGILTLVSCSGIIPCTDSIPSRRPEADVYLFGTPYVYVVFVSGTFIPAIPQIARDLSTTPEMVRYIMVLLTSIHISSPDIFRHITVASPSASRYSALPLAAWPWPPTQDSVSPNRAYALVHPF